MNSQSAIDRLGSIDRTIEEIESISGLTSLAKSYFAKFLVVYICGMYEELIETAVNEFAQRHTSRPEISYYIADSLYLSFRNPTYDKLIALTKKFNNEDWTTSFKEAKTLTEKTALESLVANKNSVAHGGNSSITLGEVKTYYEQSRPLIERFDQLIL